MRLAQVSTVISTVALGVSVAFYLKVVQLEDVLTSRAEPKGGMETPAGLADADRAYALPADGAGTREDGGSRAFASEERAGRAPEPEARSLEERITKLERDQQTLQARHAMPARFADRFVHSMDDLTTQLSLTTTQRTRVEDAVARGRERIEDILKIPDETGKSPFERRAETRKRIQEAMKNPEPGGGVLAFASDLMSHRNKKIPGRNETYADAINRVRKETREEISSALDATQREKFGETNIDGLMGEGGQVSFAVAVGDSGAGESGEMVVEMGASIETGADTGERDAAKAEPGGR